MLAKHGWKFLTKPHTLVAQIYKAKYFPTTNFLEATLGSNPSFTWRSVWMAKSILVRGCRWRVGKGNEINMWNSPWLRNLPSNMLQTSPPPGTENLKVCNIITENRTWNMELMRTMLCYSDIEQVCRVYLSPRPIPDRIIWCMTKRGQYSVKSGYWLHKNRSASSNQVNNRGWAKL